MIHIRSFSACRPLWRAILLLIVSLCDQCFRKGGCVTAECFLRHAMRTNHKRIILISQSFRATTTAPQPREPFKEFCLLKFWEVMFALNFGVTVWSLVNESMSHLWRVDFERAAAEASSLLFLLTQVSFSFVAFRSLVTLVKLSWTCQFLKWDINCICTMFHKVSVFVSCERREYDYR